MPRWLEIVVTTVPECLDPLSDWLTAEDVGGLVLEDASDFQRFLQENRARWDSVDDALLERWRDVCRIKFYLPDTRAGAQTLDRVRAGIDALAERLGCPPERFSLAAGQMDSADWENSWKQFYRPMAVGKRLFLVPEWERAPQIPPGRVVLRMNPGLLFGTGDHPSTQLCLEAAERYTARGARVLDLGCGSGILSIAALLLGAATAAACDIDELAAGVAAANAAHNQIPENRLELHTGNVLTDGLLVKQLTAQPSDLIFANIVADVVIPLSARVGDWLSAEGVFICSGIIDTRAEEVAAALRENGLSILEKNERAGWVSYVCGRCGG